MTQNSEFLEKSKQENAELAALKDPAFQKTVRHIRLFATVSIITMLLGISVVAVTIYTRSQTPPGSISVQDSIPYDMTVSLPEGALLLHVSAGRYHISYTFRHKERLFTKVLRAKTGQLVGVIRFEDEPRAIK